MLWDVLVVEDSPAVAGGVDVVLGADPRFRILAVVGTAAEALAVAEASGEDVDVIVLDDRLSGPTSGLQVAPQLRRLCPRARLILFSTTAEGQGDAAVDAAVDKATPEALLLAAQRLLGLVPLASRPLFGTVATPPHPLDQTVAGDLLHGAKRGVGAGRPFADFNDAGEAVLQHLGESVGLGLWMLLLRRDADTLEVVAARGDAYDVQVGDAFVWSESFWSEMVSHRWRAVDEVTPTTSTETVGGRRLDIGAYVAAGLPRSDGSVFGVLCGLDPLPQPDLSSQGPLVSVLALTLGTLHTRERTILDQARRLEQAEANAFLDPLTGLYNRRGWDRLLEAEEQRCRRFDTAAAIIYLDLDNLKTVNDTVGHAAGDAQLRGTGEILRSVMRRHDVAARLGGDEFAVLAVACTAQGGAVLVRRVKEALRDRQITASVGMAARESGRTLEETCRAADAAMYAEKQRARG